MSARARQANGYTLVELVVAFLLFGVIISSAVGLLISQRRLYDIHADKIELQMNVRAAVELVASELRTVPQGGIVDGKRDSVVVRFPYRWGLVCSYANKTTVKDAPDPPAPDAELYLPTNTDPLFSGHSQAGVAYKNSSGTWTYINDTDEPWEDSLYVESTVACIDGPGGTVNKDQFDKEGNLIAAGDSAEPNYRRWVGYMSYTGEEARHGVQVITYANVTYRFDDSDFEPGTRALWRVTAAGAQELAGLFDTDAKFMYLFDNDVAREEIPAGQLPHLTGIRINASATKENQAGGADRAIDYDATVDVTLRNAGEEE